MRAPLTGLRFGVALLLAASILLGSAGKAPAAAKKETPPFARVYLALRGCTSCSHCRTAIRQMARSSAEGGETRLSGDRIEVRYPTPRAVPLRDVIRRLAENRLHDLNLVDVLFEARGTFASGPAGTTVFTLRETGQSFPIAVAASLRRPANGEPVRLVALVEGWREKGDLRLTAREIHDEA